MHIAVSWQLLPEFAIVGLAATALTAALIVALMPLMVRYAMAKPNARSSHATPTPQGGGMAVVTAVVLLGVATMLYLPNFDVSQVRQLWVLFGAVALLALVGAVDDIRTIEAIPRLMFQFLAVGVVVVLLPDEVRVLPFAPLWLERTLAVFAGVWCVNLVNFMDGIDCMTVTEFVPLSAALCLLAIVGALPLSAMLVAFAVLGAMTGFDGLIRAVVFALESSAAANQTYIVADPAPISVSEMIAALRHGLDRTPGLIPVPRALLRTALTVIGQGDALDRIDGQLIASSAKLVAAGWIAPPQTETSLTAMARQITAALN